MTIEKYIPVNEAAKKLKISVRRLRLRATSGTIKAAMINDTLFINVSDTEETQITRKQFANLKGTGISVRAAEKKYGVPNPTISRWVTKGYIRVVQESHHRGQARLIDESDVAYCAAVYKADPGQGKSTLANMLDDN